MTRKRKKNENEQNLREIQNTLKPSSACRMQVSGLESKGHEKHSEI